MKKKYLPIILKVSTSNYYIVHSWFLPDFTGIMGEGEITRTIYQSLPRKGILNYFQIKVKNSCL